MEYKKIYLKKNIEKQNPGFRRIKQLNTAAITEGTTTTGYLVTGIFPPLKIPPGRFHPGCFPPTKPGFAKYDVEANLFPLESSILTRAQRAKNRNNAATNRKIFGFFRGSIPRTGYLYNADNDHIYSTLTFFAIARFRCGADKEL